MDRSDITNSLSDLVRKKLANTCNFWAEEVELDFGKARVDFVGFKPFNILQNGMCAASIDKGTFSFYEVKSCMADFTSGHGKNFLGDENYLVCEKDLATDLYTKGMLPHGVKVLVPNKPRTALIVAYDLSSSFGTWSRRTKSSSELLWNMISARKSNKVIDHSQNQNHIPGFRKSMTEKEFVEAVKMIDITGMSEIEIKNQMEDIWAWIIEKKDQQISY